MNQAIGDKEGSVHILELPTTLFRIIGDEIKSMEEFWKREVERVQYFEQRFELRAENFKLDKLKREQ